MKLIHKWTRMRGPRKTVTWDGPGFPDTCPLFVASKTAANEHQWCRSENGYYVLNVANAGIAGPYKTRKAALIAADMMHALKEYPK
jgi:hypothetical protein